MRGWGWGPCAPLGCTPTPRKHLLPALPAQPSLPGIRTRLRLDGFLRGRQHVRGEFAKLQEDLQGSSLRRWDGATLVWRLPPSVAAPGWAAWGSDSALGQSPKPILTRTLIQLGVRHKKEGGPPAPPYEAENGTVLGGPSPGQGPEGTHGQRLGPKLPGDGPAQQKAHGSVNSPGYHPRGWFTAQGAVLTGPAGPRPPGWRARGTPSPSRMKGR